jgi:GNAT superfamily N-acetyltransferase
MYWRLRRSQFEQQKGAANKEAMRALIEGGEVPGLLGYLDAKAVGWIALAPRAEYVRLETSRVLKPLDDQQVWSISCLFVDKAYRKRGISVALLRAAVEYVHEQGGQTVEGYPVEPVKDEVPAAFAWTGLASAFLAAGFCETGRGSPTRPIMRFVIEA